MSNTGNDQSRLPIRTDMLIGGHPVSGEGEWLEVVNPATEATVAKLKAASVSQVDAAVRSAESAFADLSWSDGAYRRQVLLKFADLLEENRDPLMDLLIAEVGTPASLKANHIDTPIMFLRWFAEAAVRDRTRQLGFNPAFSAVSSVAYRPVGVVAAITAFNYPILIGVTKIAAALAAGCTAVLLTSPQAPLAVLFVGELVRRAGFPAGTINIVAGGAEIGRALTEHPGISKVSFTGSVAVGRTVMRQAATGLASVVLELGGKSAAVMLPGVDFDKYALSLHMRYARNAGQGCGSPTRILVEASRYDEFAEISRKVYPQIKVGDPRESSTTLGPVVSAAQRQRIENTVAAAVADGATIIAGGGRPNIDKGWYLNPVLIGGVDNKSNIAREEIFGPVSVVMPYHSVEEAIEITNDSDLGLKTYLFGQRDQCLRLVPSLRVGTVQINGGSPLRPDAPMTGYKHSGVGSEWGEDGLREFLRPQHIDCALG
ncbi:aldehyde dehydrogenase family protein [Caballeronia sp. GAWG2-1]|uniref:aldehyde dehydrogenase family protein n=1 Tax=Caballeronia sp. GAWG2-1 TaxID=2921744 RepID=UPI0020298B37|nr:aldehyde dehydrogenase family protein [Caballeronia sp. GAWG2-1]